MTGLVAPAGGGRAPAVMLNGTNNAPPAGKAPAPVRPPARVFGGPNPGGLASAQNSTAGRPPSGPGPNPGGLANPQNNPPRSTATRRPTTPAASVARAKASASSGTTVPKAATSAQIMAAAERQAAAIYNPAIANYNAQQSAQNGLAEKRTADLAAFGQWYQGQQNELAAQETQRQSQLSDLLGQLNQNPASGSPSGGVQSSIGDNLSQTNGGQASMAAQGDNAATSGLLSTNALASASNTNSSQNELTALGGSYQQNMMGEISADLTKNTTAIQDAESKVQTAEGSTASKLDSTFQTAQTAGQKNYLTYLNANEKNQIQSNYDSEQANSKANYDSEQANSKAASEVLATAEANGWTPSLRAAYARYMGGAVPAAGPTVAQQKVDTAAKIAQQKANQAAYDGVTKRLSEQVAGQKVADTYALGQIKNTLTAAANGEKVKYTNAQIKYYAARIGTSIAQAKSDLIRAAAYANYENSRAATGGTTTANGTLTANEMNTQLKSSQTFATELAAGIAKGAIPKDANGAHKWMIANGYKANPLAMAAFDRQFYGAITPNTANALVNQEHWTRAAVQSTFGTPKAP